MLSTSVGINWMQLQGIQSRRYTYESYEHSIPIDEKPHATASASDCTEGIAACAFAGMSLAHPCQEEYIRNPVNRSLSLLAPHMKEPPRFVRHTYVSAISATRVK